MKPQQCDDFMIDYCDTVAGGDLGGFTEKIANRCPVVVDIDMRTGLDEFKEIDRDDLPRLYTHDDVAFVVRTYLDLFRILFPGNDAWFTCVVLEKRPYLDGDRIKHGFHLHFPKVRLPVEDHTNHIIPAVAPKIDAYFGRKVFDLGIYSGSWLLYGSVKSLSTGVYKMSRIYDGHMQIVSPEVAFADAVITRLKDSQPIQRTHRLAYYYPFILSMVYNAFPRPDPLTVEIDFRESAFVREITQMDFHIANKSNFTVLSDEQYMQNREVVANLLKMIHPDRASDYNHWINVGFAIFNACGPSQESLSMWIEFSKTTTQQNFSQLECCRRWRSMSTPAAGGAKRTIGTLHHMASEDSPEAYTKLKFQENFFRASLNAAIDGSHYDIAELMFVEYGDRYRCVSITNRKWYVFENHVWHLTDAGIHLRKRISTVIHQYFSTIQAEIRALADSAPDDMTRAQHEARLKTVRHLKNNLRNNGFKEHIMAECREHFYDPDFEDELDMNRYLFAFRNGVYDLRNHVLRCGLPEDMLNKQSPVDYIDYDMCDPEILVVQDLLCKIFVNNEIREYFVQAYSMIFIGGNQNKKFYFWTGGGNNGKTVLCQLFEAFLGPYAQKPQTSVLTEKRGKATQADPTMARTKGARWLVFQEPSPRDHINTGVMKELSGNDTTLSRDLFQRGSELKEITPMYKVMLMCNQMPQITDAQQAEWNRIRVIPFESTFVDASALPPTQAEQERDKIFLADPNFKDQVLPTIASPFAWYLLQHLRESNGKMPTFEPMAVKQATDAYAARNDLYTQFQHERLQQVPGNSVGVQEIYGAFNTWYNEQGRERGKLPTRAEFMDRMAKILGAPNKQQMFAGWTWLQLDPTNVYGEFQSDCLQSRRGEHTPMEEVYVRFKEWYLESGEREVHMLPNMQDMRNGLYEMMDVPVDAAALDDWVLC